MHENWNAPGKLHHARWIDHVDCVGIILVKSLATWCLDKASAINFIEASAVNFTD
jgi:hypothetical protein